MQTTSMEKSFGLLIAFVIPGMIGLFAVSLHVDVLKGWLGTLEDDKGPTGGALILVLLLAIGMGVFIAGIRRLLIDYLWRGAPPPNRSGGTDQALIEELYRYAQFHGNMIIATTSLFGSWMALPEGNQELSFFVVLGFWIAITVICWMAGRRILKEYDDRSSASG